MKRNHQILIILKKKINQIKFQIEKFKIKMNLNKIKMKIKISQFNYFNSVINVERDLFHLNQKNIKQNVRMLLLE